jgi:hypothetical protein
MNCNGMKFLLRFYFMHISHPKYRTTHFKLATRSSLINGAFHLVLPLVYVFSNTTGRLNLPIFRYAKSLASPSVFDEDALSLAFPWIPHIKYAAKLKTPVAMLWRLYIYVACGAPPMP